jgi:DnaJ-class molecular chaperone
MSQRCVFCNGRGWLIFHGKEVPCLDCRQVGFHKHCLACKGKGVLDLGGGDYVECPECQGTGGLLRRRTHTAPTIITVSQSAPLEAEIIKERTK